MRMSSKQYKEMYDDLQTEVKSKYKSRKTEVDGKMFDSLKEANRYKELMMLQKAGKVKDVECQVSFEIYPKFKTPEGVTLQKRVYRADFVYFDVGLDKKVIEDTKGYATQEFKRKWRQMQERYGREYVFLIS